MTRNQLNQYLAATITTLDEVDFAPETSLYLGLGSDMEIWDTVKTVLQAGNLATFDTDYTVKITPEGHALAAKINAFAAANR